MRDAFIPHLKKWAFCYKKRKHEDESSLFKFVCECGDFVVDSVFAARIEFIGCRSWLPANDNYNEPYLIKIDEKHRTVEIGKWGKTFIDLSCSEMSDMCDAYDEEDGFSRLIDICKDAYPE